MIELKVLRSPVFFLLVSLCLSSAGQAQEQTRQDGAAASASAGKPDPVETGRGLFASMCAGCHGTGAEGGRGPNLEDGQLVRLKDDHHLFDSIRKGVPGSEMPPFSIPDEQIWQLLAFVRSLSAPAAQSKVPGDAEAGRAIYYHKANCDACHAILGRGGSTGPDLSNVGMSHSWKQLRQALVDPKSRSREGYQGATVLTKSGARLTGILKDHTNYSLAIQDAQGNLHLLSMQDVREVALQPGSLMPDDYNRRLTAKELEDVLAFLSRQSVRPVKAPSSSTDPAKGSK